MSEKNAQQPNQELAALIKPEQTFQSNENLTVGGQLTLDATIAPEHALEHKNLLATAAANVNEAIDEQEFRNVVDEIDFSADKFSFFASNSYHAEARTSGRNTVTTGKGRSYFDPRTSYTDPDNGKNLWGNPRSEAHYGQKPVERVGIRETKRIEYIDAEKIVPAKGVRGKLGLKQKVTVQKPQFTKEPAYFFDYELATPSHGDEAAKAVGNNTAQHIGLHLEITKAQAEALSKILKKDPAVARNIIDAFVSKTGDAEVWNAKVFDDNGNFQDPATPHLTDYNKSGHAKESGYTFGRDKITGGFLARDVRPNYDAMPDLKPEVVEVVEDNKKYIGYLPKISPQTKPVGHMYTVPSEIDSNNTLQRVAVGALRIKQTPEESLAIKQKPPEGFVIGMPGENGFYVPADLSDRIAVQNVSRNAKNRLKMPTKRSQVNYMEDGRIITGAYPDLAIQASIESGDEADNIARDQFRSVVDEQNLNAKYIQEQKSVYEYFHAKRLSIDPLRFISKDVAKRAFGITGQKPEEIETVLGQHVNERAVTIEDESNIEAYGHKYVLGLALHEAAHSIFQNVNILRTVKQNGNKIQPASFETAGLGKADTRKESNNGTIGTFWNEAFADLTRVRALREMGLSVDMSEAQKDVKVGDTTVTFRPNDSDRSRHSNGPRTIVMPAEYLMGVSTTNDGKNIVGFSPPNFTAYALDLLDERAPGLYDDLLASSREPKRQSAAIRKIEGIKPGLYRKLSELKYNQPDFIRGLEMVIDAIDSNPTVDN